MSWNSTSTPGCSRGSTSRNITVASEFCRHRCELSTKRTSPRRAGRRPSGPPPRPASARPRRTARRSRARLRVDRDEPRPQPWSSIARRVELVELPEPTSRYSAGSVRAGTCERGGVEAREPSVHPRGLTRGAPSAAGSASPDAQERLPQLEDGAEVLRYRSRPSSSTAGSPRDGAPWPHRVPHRVVELDGAELPA